ncbi:MAG: gamma-glutamyltransferase [Calditrichaeota bacterium]|nr:gamma-glutamyltransferase [Candidatus Cloacimonadota bacterium]MCB1047094.1 gamma-glutamyltransferase [Calditrichota bacterium]
MSRSRIRTLLCSLLLSIPLLVPRLQAARAMVVSAHPLASEVGLQVIAEGGSAADAAVAALCVLNVVEPHASGLGGGGFALWRGANGYPECIDYREVAPAGLDTTVYYDPADSLHLARIGGGPTVGVPATALGLHRLWQRHGRLPISRLLQPAIDLARRGYPVSEALATQITEHMEGILEDEQLSTLFLMDGLPPSPGDTLHNEPLALVFEDLVRQGLDSFPASQGAALAATVQAAGGWITAADLENYQVLIREPLRSSYRGMELLSPPPPATGGLALMECLNILEPVDLNSLDEVQWRHLFCEAHKKAARDRSARAGDPAFYTTPLDSLLDKTLARRVLDQIHPDGVHGTWPALGSQSYGERAASLPVHGEVFPPKDHGNTTHISIWDEQGNLLSLTQSINYFFGSGLIVNGYLLNNQMSDFSFETDDPLNRPAPGKRPRSSMAPLIGLREGQPVLCLGTPGGPRIPGAMEQILINHIDFGMSLQQAIDAPRMHPMGLTLVHETRLAPELIAALADLGYKPYPYGDFNSYFGGAHGIARAADGTLEGGADPRRGGQVAGYDR